MIINTKYYYQEGWQYQTIKVNTKNLDMIRQQNWKDKDGVIMDTIDIIPIKDKGWDYLFKTHGYPALKLFNQT